MNQNSEANKLASSISQLKSSALKAASERNKLPHTLFWSLFRVQLAQIKLEKAKKRAIQRLIFDIDFA